MHTLVVLVASLCVLSSVYGATYNKVCQAGNNDCTEANTVCAIEGDMSGKCTCATNYSREADACKAIVQGPCANASECVSNTDCNGGKCVCKTGYKESNFLCIAVYDSTCNTSDDCTALAHSECTGDSMMCKCVIGYKHNNSECIKKVIGDTCKNDADCQAAVTNSICLSAEQTYMCSCANGYLVAAQAAECTQVYDSTCNTSDDCTALAHSECTGDPDKMCKCVIGYKHNNSECIKKVIGDTCKNDADCQAAVTNSICLSAEQTYMCSCANGYLVAAQAAECTQVYDSTCNTSDDCTALAHSECTGDPDKMCKCVIGYKHNNSECIKKVIGDTCKNDADCQAAVTNSICLSAEQTYMCSCANGYLVAAQAAECTQVYDSTCNTSDDCTALAHSECTGDPDKMCKCVSGYKHDNAACIMKIIGDTCTDDADCQAAFTNSKCISAEQTKTCSCDNGYSGEAQAALCTQVYEKECVVDGNCTNLKYGKCSAQKCICGDTAVVEGVICNLRINQNCADEDICPMHSTCKAADNTKKCQCDDKYITQDYICKAENSGMSAVASFFLLVAALALLFLL